MSTHNLNRDALPTIVFLTAIPLEYQAVRVHLPDAPLTQQWDDNQTKLYEMGEYLTPQQTRCQIIVRQLEGMGNLVALSETKDVITQFQPNYLFFVGIAAKLKDVELGDVVVPPWIKGYETGKLQEDEWLSRAPVAYASKRLLEMVRHLVRDEQWQVKIKPVPTPKKPKALVAPIVSGEKVVDSPEFLKQLRHDHSNAAAVEMEGLGFLHAICETPRVEGIVIRGISDAGENKGETDKQGWQEKAASHAAAFAFALLDELLDKAKELPLPPNPYPGLKAFRPEDAKNFFGRDVETQQLLAKVLANPFVVVIGASGSGKSSLVFAGLVPALAPEQWLCVDFRIQENAPSQAPRALVLYAPHKTELASLTAKFSDTSLPLSAIVKNIFEESHYQKSLLMVIDQFEELYTVTSDKALQQHFLDWLLEAVESLKKFTQVKLRVVLTLRVDFMKDGLAYPPFTTALNQGNDIKLGPIATEARIRQVIEGPAQGSAVTLEDGLTERILQDLQQQQEVPLPLLQFALEKLWEQQQEKKLTHVAYEEIGSLKGALSNYAETQYEALKSGGAEKALQHIFTQLVYSATNTKRVATIEQIGPANWALVGKLVDARLVITRREEASQLETVELVHEVLISSWGRLSHWVDDSREFRSWQDKLEEDITRWESAHRDEGALLRGARLVEAEEKLKQYGEVVTAGERAFIDASVALREKEVQEREQQAQLLHEQRNRALVSQSLILSYIANQHVENNPFTAIRLAFESLPNLSESVKERPEVKEVYPVLLDAINQYRLGIIEHDDGVNFSEFSPNGNFLLSYGGNVAYIWSFPDFYLHATLLGHKDKIWSATFSSDSRLIVTTSEDKTAILWEVATGKQVFILQGHTARVRSAAFSHDNKYVVTASFDSSVRVWKIETGRQIAISQENIGKIWSATFTPDNRHILISSDKCVLLWDIRSLEKYIVIESDKRFNLFSKLVFSKDKDIVFLIKQSNMFVSVVFLVKGKEKEIVTITVYTEIGGSSTSMATNFANSLVATSYNEHTVHLWNIETTKLVLTAQKHDKSINSIVFDKNDRFILTASEDRKAILWNIQERKQHVILEGHTSGVNSAHFSPDGKYVVTASKDRTIRLWHVDTGKAISIYKTDNSGLDSYVAFSPDGGYLATQSGKNIYLWQVENDRLSETSITFSGHKKTVNAIAFSPNNKYLASASKDGTAIVWDRTTCKTVNLLKQHKDEVLFVAFSRDNKWLVTTSKDKTACVWKTDTGELVNILRGHTDEIKSASFDIHSNYVFTVSKDKTIRVWEVQTGLLIHTLTEHTDGINSIALSFTGKYIATASADKTCIIWETSTRTMVQKLLGHTGTINAVIFHPNDEVVITGANDSTVRLWEITTGKQLFELHAGHFVSSISLSPDKKYIAVGLWNGNIRLWRIFEHIEEMIAYAKKILPSSDIRPDPMLLTCEERKRFFLEELERCK